MGPFFLAHTPLTQAGVMKPAQTVGLLILAAVMVFAVTFASMYVAPSPPSSTPRKKVQRPAVLHLTFPEVRYPVRKPEESEVDYAMKRVVTEYDRTGQHDFWFNNQNDEEVRVGLSATCTCSGLSLFVAPEDWRSLVAADRGYQPAAGNPNRRPELAAKATSLREITRDGITVPARAFGFIRVKWEARRPPEPGSQWKYFTAELWFQDPKWSSFPLEIGAILADGVEINATDINAGVLSANAVAAREILCWSLSRSAFDVELVSAGAPFVTCTSKTPLTDEERRALSDRGIKAFLKLMSRQSLTAQEKRDAAVRGPVRSGYRLTIQVREQVGGARLDEGPFSHTVEVRTPRDVRLPRPLEVAVRGRVRGDIHVVGAETGISLKPFAVRDGIADEAILQTDRSDIQLSLASAPKFLQVQLGKPKDEGGRRTWALALEIKPNAVSGVFPRADNAALQDTAIYLKIMTPGAASRRLRIPVAGNAAQ